MCGVLLCVCRHFRLFARDVTVLCGCIRVFVIFPPIFCVGVAVGRPFTLELLYTANKAVWSLAAFHSACDNKGATLCLFRTSVGGVVRVCGGFTTAAWESCSPPKYKTCAKTCLISVANGSGAFPVTFAPVLEPKYAIYCYSVCGPDYGGWSEMCISRYFALYSNYPQSGGRFSIAGVTDNIFVGTANNNKYLAVDCVEVWRVV